MSPLRNKHYKQASSLLAFSWVCVVWFQRIALSRCRDRCWWIRWFRKLWRMAVTTEWWTFQLCSRHHVCPVKGECWDARLLHERVQLGAILAVSPLPPLLRDLAASDQGPGHHTATHGVVAARRPPMKRTTNHARTATSVAPSALACQPGSHGLRCGFADGAGPWMCTGCDPCLHEDPGQVD